MELDLVRYRTADINLPSQRCCLNEGKRGNGIVTETRNRTEYGKQKKEKRNYCKRDSSGRVANTSSLSQTDTALFYIYIYIRAMYIILKNKLLFNFLFIEVLHNIICVKYILSY